MFLNTVYPLSVNHKLSLQKKSFRITCFLQDMSEWTSCQAKLNEAGNLLIEVTESSTSLALSEQLSKVNMQWAECMKRTMFVSMNVLTSLSTESQTLHED